MSDAARRSARDVIPMIQDEKTKMGKNQLPSTSKSTYDKAQDRLQGKCQDN